MGLYIDPSAESKEAWLGRHAHAVNPGIFGDSPREQFEGLCAYEQLPVCLIDSGAFTAAGIAWSLQEYRRFLAGMQGRRHRWYTASRADLAKLPGLASLRLRSHS